MSQFPFREAARATVLCVFLQTQCVYAGRKIFMLYVCVFKSMYFLRSYAMVAACACCSAPVLLCFGLWVGGGNLLICRASWLPIIKELLLYLASPPSNGHTGYSFFQRQSSINPHPLWPATSRACLKGPMMLLPGRPCSCRPHGSPDAPSAPAPAPAHFSASFLSLLPVTGTSRGHFSLSSVPPNLAHPFELYNSSLHTCWSSFPNSTSWVRGFTRAQTTAIALFHVMEHQTRSIQERNLTSPFLLCPVSIMLCLLALHNLPSSFYPISYCTFCLGHHPHSDPLPNSFFHEVPKLTGISPKKAALTYHLKEAIHPSLYLLHGSNSVHTPGS